ncbi:MAG: GntR family transcriptional regulator [Actinomycetota bacterium]|nr:GntR family transcriptional regulator [Actinomycetota bacterium]
MNVNLERAADRAYQLLRNDIVAGILTGGRHLAETELAEQYGLSRTPIRESLRRLQAEGLVEVIPHRGARVVDWHSYDVEGMYDLRAAVEAFVARRAATRLSEDQIQSLSALCDRMETVAREGRAGDPETVTAFTELNAEFHGSVAQGADASYALPARNVLVVLPVILQAVHNYAPMGYTRSNNNHRELLDAFRAKDPDWAEHVMRTHVLSSKSSLMAQLRRTAPQETST